MKNPLPGFFAAIDHDIKVCVRHFADNMFLTSRTNLKHAAYCAARKLNTVATWAREMTKL
jgi:hypothetical protein